MVYAIGDVHGRDDLLDVLLKNITTDAAGLSSAKRPLLIFLGDLVDRGDSSAGVVERVLKTEAEGAFEVVCLIGNHEEALLRFIQNPLSVNGWLKHGGVETLASYGHPNASPNMGANALEVMGKAFLASLPPTHLSLFLNLQRYLVVGDYLFVHAGVKPGVPLAEQHDRDLFWIRRPFLEHAAPSEHIVVHGHTPAEGPELLTGRIGIDTGAYASGVLTAIRLIDNERVILQARDNRFPI